MSKLKPTNNQGHLSAVPTNHEGGRFKHQAALIKKYRSERTFTQEKLTEGAEISYQFLSNIERGRAGIPFKYIVPICDKLQIPYSELKEAILRDWSDRIDAVIWDNTEPQEVQDGTL